MSPADAPGFAFDRRARRRTPISLTPLIDIIFILLVFFMLASSFHDWRRIRLDPPAPAATSPSGAGETMLVAIRPDGLRLAGRPIGRAALLDRVAVRLARHPAQAVVIRPARGVVVQDVVGLLDALAARGVRRLSLSPLPD